LADFHRLFILGVALPFGGGESAFRTVRFLKKSPCTFWKPSIFFIRFDAKMHASPHGLPARRCR